ncbi:hypothetical protein QR680_017070 [Steinernema hermaphroditum]|uniref:H15 domain-containing protein n=1 Tax=Steinernema hermaphroditum TaxID=289476 RepID=A0AA39HED8_9BILA|nr:hypothetical protein QR680_017070 [Steinernema hermaphroditum]
MADVAPAEVIAPVAEAAPAAAPKGAKKAKAAAPKKEKKAPAAKKAVPSHPTYQVMIKKAIESLKERNGSSKTAIFKFICSNFSVGDNQIQINSHLRLALKRATASGFLKQTSGTGASGSFRIAEPKTAKAAAKTKKVVAAKKEKKAVAKKPVKKAKAPKKEAGKKPKTEKKAKATVKKSAKAPGAKKVPSPKKMKAAPASKIAKKPVALKKAAAAKPTAAKA